MRCLAFDLGRVLFDFDYNIALDKIKNVTGASSDEIVDALFYKQFAADFERGLVSPRDFYVKFTQSFKADLGFEEFIRVWCEIFSPKPEVISLVRQLRLIYPVYLISNINEAHFNYLHQNFYDVFSLFDGLILSFKVDRKSVV